MVLDNDCAGLEKARLSRFRSSRVGDGGAQGFGNFPLLVLGQVVEEGQRERAPRNRFR
jgi:hypothetical protein